MKCRQRVCRPLGEIIPLSDRASRDNGNAKGPGEYIRVKAILEELT